MRLRQRISQPFRLEFRQARIAPLAFPTTDVRPAAPIDDFPWLKLTASAALVALAHIAVFALPLWWTYDHLGQPDPDGAYGFAIALTVASAPAMMLSFVAGLWVHRARLRMTPWWVLCLLALLAPAATRTAVPLLVPDAIGALVLMPGLVSAGLLFVRAILRPDRSARGT